MLCSDINVTMWIVFFLSRVNWALQAPNCLVIKTLWPEFARELYRQSDRRLSAKLVPNFADRGCHVVIAMGPFGRVLAFLDQTV
jgi:hypothetical protein